SICWRLSSGAPKNVAPYLQVLSSHLSVTGYRLVFGGDAERTRWCARLSSRKNRSNGGKTVQAQHCSIRYGEPQRSKTGAAIIVLLIFAWSYVNPQLRSTSG